MVRVIFLVMFVQLAGPVIAANESTDKAEVLPQGSELINLNGHSLHIRKLGNPIISKPYLLLLSGPTDNWHSDSGWWALAQNVLAEDYYTVAIDRAGHSWSEPVAKPSYQQFGKDVSSYIRQQREPVIIVAFASSNLSLHMAMQDTEATQYIKGAVLIDPDVLTDHSINHYSTETERYREGWQEIEQYITSGQYDENIQQKIIAEKEHLKTIIPEAFENHMDWDYYEAVEAIRNTRSFQLEKFRETTHYRNDLLQAKKHPLPESLPLVVIDSDFETAYLPKIEDESVKASIVQWRDEGRDWFFKLAQNSQCGAYWPLESQEHLIMMEQPELITRAVEKLLLCE
ncbi:alpha/beta fold hydrolase [Kangiella aquimarina]|uniref:Alpha/beta hydrolase n=1 Tax=Kangiella aquimarina TaxID=261965 RepID=A0ABZ0X656_9GAMM|nr:alpha/beta hydrolase [Kangiella aquimarina]WQG85844.1 alpha/beta hydrolase [Kangiella aquimarina]